jgi:putative oxidoreductase
MDLVHKIENWGDTHHPKLLDVVRVALGVFLFLKGLAFMDNTADLKGIIESQDSIVFPASALMILVYYVTFAHMVGGIMIALGILTRFTCIIQVPIMVGAVIMNDVLISPINTQLWLSVITLVLLFVFMILGSGPLSLDRYLENQSMED